MPMLNVTVLPIDVQSEMRSVVARATIDPKTRHKVCDREPDVCERLILSLRCLQNWRRNTFASLTFGCC